MNPQNRLIFFLKAGYTLLFLFQSTITEALFDYTLLSITAQYREIQDLNNNREFGAFLQNQKTESEHWEEDTSIHFRFPGSWLTALAH